MSTSLPLAQWPLVLCGPILRRVEPRLVTAFVALKTACNVELLLYARADPAATDAPLAQSAAQPTIALGRNLHVRVVQLQIRATSPALTPGTSYGYNLRLTQTPGGQVSTLRELGLLSGPYSLGYGDGRLPSFALPTGLDTLNVIYGSCRKAHGKGFDALAALDLLIGNALRPHYAAGVTVPQRQGATRRPHQLLLGGDQIYADDVAVSLLRVLIDTGKDLLAWSTPEQILIGSTNVDSDHPMVQPGPWRQSFAWNQALLTSELVEAHLVYWPEFLAMYLLGWSEALWPRGDFGAFTLPTAAQVMAAQGRQASAGQLKDWDKQRAEALTFAQSLPSVRRALANVPTYMIFDDHEISDDWNLNLKWRDSVRGTTAGRRVLRNGLLSYAVFQDWGNQADRYASGPGKQLLDAITYAPSSGVPPKSANPDTCSKLLDIQPPGATPPTLNERMIWDFVATGPQHQVIAMDSRTWRFFPPPASQNRQAPGLIVSDGLKRRLDDRRPTDGRLTLVIATAPVLGHYLVEELAQRLMVALDAEFGAEKWDLEPWSGHRPTFEDLLRRLSAFGRVVLLSGDVHYGFTNHLAYFRDDTPAAAPARIVQLCSSALKNEETKTYVVGAIGHLGIERTGWLGFRDDLSAAASDDVLQAMLTRATQEGSLPTQGQRDLTTLLFKVMTEERFKAPAVLPSGPWITQSAYQIVQALAENVVTHARTTDWSYTINYVSDTRTAARRVSDAPGISSHLSRAGTHQVRTFVSDYYRSVVGVSNLAQVRFRAATSGGAIDQVVHRLYWYAFGDDGPIFDALMFTEHVAPLSQPTPAERPVVFQ